MEQTIAMSEIIASQLATSFLSHPFVTGTQPTSFLKDYNPDLFFLSTNASAQAITGSSVTPSNLLGSNISIDSNLRHNASAQTPGSNLILSNLLGSDISIDSYLKHEDTNKFLELSIPTSTPLFCLATENMNSIIERYPTCQTAIPIISWDKNTQAIGSMIPSLNLPASHLSRLSHINLDISDIDIYEKLHTTHLPIHSIEKKRKVINRANNIVLLLNEICVTNPIRIDKSRITTSIEAINLAWIIAICQAKYNAFKDIELRSLTLQAGANYIHKRIIDSLRQSGNLSRLQQHSSQEVDMVFADVTTLVLNYTLPLDLIQKLLTNDPAFSECCLQKKNLNFHPTSTKKELATKSVQLKIKHIPLTTRKNYNPETSLAQASKMRHKNNHAMKDEAISLYQSKEYKSKASAAKEIFPLLNKYCKEKKIKTLTTTNGEQTIYKWLCAVR